MTLAIQDAWPVFELVNAALWGLVETIATFFQANPVVTLCVLILFLLCRHK